MAKRAKIGDSDICGKCGRPRTEHHEFKRKVPRGCECVLDDDDWGDGAPIPPPCRHFWASCHEGVNIEDLCGDCDHYLRCHKRDKRWPAIRALFAVLPRHPSTGRMCLPMIRLQTVEQIRDVTDRLAANNGPSDYWAFDEWLRGLGWETAVP